MGRPREVPEGAELKRLVEEHGTISAIVDHLYRSTGRRFSRSTISSAIARERLDSPHRARYSKYIPWQVRSEHDQDHALRMLRWYARSCGEGEPLAEAQREKLDRWLERLEETDSLIGYAPEEGFVVVRRADVVGRDDLEIGPGPTVRAKASNGPAGPTPARV